MNYTLTDKQRILIVNALKNHYPNCCEEDQDEMTWLIDLIDLKKYITLSDSQPPAILYPLEMEYKHQLDLLKAKEQLIADINSIVEDITYGALSPSEMNTLTRKLCDAVYKHLPTPD